ncbi:hypothetical protein ACH5RR_019269 [Cinchona calisaya]|uniref:Uncharacterized protein n=1 Tax=Cinchona calisaya TaxID=153742 RepID=A0ABD2ZNW0_9GENT
MAVTVKRNTLLLKLASWNVKVTINIVLDKVDFASTISQTTYELKKALLKKCTIPVQKCLRDQGSVHEIVLSIQQDVAVAYGAAIQAATPRGNGKVQDIRTISSLGVETVMISQNTLWPMEKELLFSTLFDNQPGLLIQTFEGESTKTSENNLLGELNVLEIAPASKGVPEINICFIINVNSNLKVSAEDKSTLKMHEITFSIAVKRSLMEETQEG